MPSLLPALSALTLIALGLGTCTGQITFPVTADDGCNTLPSPCRCQTDIVECTCLQQATSLVLSHHPYGNRKQVVVRGCGEVTITEGAVVGTNVRELLLLNLLRVVLQSRSLELLGSTQRRFTLAMVNVSAVDELPAQLFEERHDDRILIGLGEDTPKVRLVVNGTSIGTAAGGVFGNSRLHDLLIVNSTIETVQSGFLNNTVEGTITLQNNIIETVDSNAFVVNRIHRLPDNIFIKYNYFTKALPHFLDASVNFDIEIANNSFSLFLESPWSLEAREDVSVENNTFTNIPSSGMNATAGARLSFSSNTVEDMQSNALHALKTKVQSTLVLLTRNRFQYTAPSSLQLPADLLTEAIIVRNNVFETPCTCNTSAAIAVAAGVQNVTMKDILSNTIIQPWLLRSTCQQHDHKTMNYSYTQVSLYHRRNCVPADVTTTVFLSVFGGALIVLACCVLLAWRRLKQKQLAPNYSTSGNPQYPDNETSWSRVLPDKQMYRETEIHVLFQRAAELQHRTQDGDNDTNGGCDNPEVVVDSDGSSNEETVYATAIKSEGREKIKRYSLKSCDEEGIINKNANKKENDKNDIKTKLAHKSEGDENIDHHKKINQSNNENIKTENSDKATNQENNLEHLAQENKGAESKDNVTCESSP